MMKTAKSAIAFAALAAATGLASVAQAKCHGSICLVVESSSTAKTVHIHFKAHVYPATHFNMIFRGVQSELKAIFAAHVSFDSASASLPRTTEKVSIQVCNRDVNSTSSSCGPWEAFTLPGSWIAIATNGHGHYGWSVRRHSSTDAQAHAVAGCGGGSCVVANVAQGSCFAYAVSSADRSIGATSIGNSINVVESDALRVCSSQAPGTCSVHKTKCVQ